MIEISQFLATLEFSTDLLTASLSQFGLLGFSICVFLFGETAIIIGLTVLPQFNFGLIQIMSSAIIGTVVADIFWFVISKYFPKQILPNWIHNKFLSPVNSTIALLIRDKILLSLIFLKFLIGIRLISIFYIARQPITFTKFISYDLLGTTFYIFILTGLFVSLSKITNSLLPSFHTLFNLLLGFIIIFVASFIINNILRTKK